MACLFIKMKNANCSVAKMETMACHLLHREVAAWPLVSSLLWVRFLSMGSFVKTGKTQKDCGTLPQQETYWSNGEMLVHLLSQLE